MLIVQKKNVLIYTTLLLVSPTTPSVTEHVFLNVPDITHAEEHGSYAKAALVQPIAHYAALTAKAITSLTLVAVQACATETIETDIAQ